MLKLGHIAKTMLLVAVSALAYAPMVPALAQAEPKQPKPLNLLAFARAGRAHKPQVPASPAALPPGEAAVVKDRPFAADDANPLITGAVPAAAPETPAAAVRPAKAVNPPGPPKSPPPAAGAHEIPQFCGSVADAAVDARLAWQLKELEKAENQLRDRIAEVEAKRAEYEKWMELRDEFLKKAEAGVVEIYSRMKPEAAALQIASMSDETAAAVLAKLSPRNSSAIFGEMDPARAAHLADLLGGMRRVEDENEKK
jgi:flagellar motility protein MotE (MotC chaperone)